MSEFDEIQHILDEVRDAGEVVAVSARIAEHDYCKCVVSHVPQPVELHLHHILPLDWGGREVEENLVLLCPTTHENVHLLLREYRRANGRPNWHVEKYFGDYARTLAALGWDQHQARLEELGLGARDDRPDHPGGH